MFVVTGELVEPVFTASALTVVLPTVKVIAPLYVGDDGVGVVPSVV